MSEFTQTSPYTAILDKIRSALKQYRYNNDNSPSIFHPASGFVYAYDSHTVDKALKELEETIPTAYEPQGQIDIKKGELLRTASILSATHSDADVKKFAAGVIRYLFQQEKANSRSPLRLMVTTPDVLDDD